MNFIRDIFYLIGIMAVAFFMLLFGMQKSDASESNYFIEAGQSSYNHPICILWHQECAGYETHWNMRRPMVRAGIDYKGYRLSYAHLGSYTHTAEATQLENCAVSRRDKSCGGETDWYHVRGAMQAIIFSYRAEWLKRKIYTEAGLGIFHQSFSLDTGKLQSDLGNGISYYHTAIGPGAMVSVGFVFQRVSLGVSLYHTAVGQYFDSGTVGPMPAGVRNAQVISMQYLF